MESTTMTARSARKHSAILAAAEKAFLRDGYQRSSVDDIAARAGVSKPTVYQHFGSKEALFVHVVSAMTGAASDRVTAGAPDPDSHDLAAYLTAYGERQLRIVLDPRLLQLRRLVIAEASRFPELARALYDGGPGRAIASLTAVVRDLAAHGDLDAPDPRAAATQLNWLIMAAPLNDAMMLGDDAIPSRARQRRHVAEAVRIFLAAYS